MTVFPRNNHYILFTPDKMNVNPHQTLDIVLSKNKNKTVIKI